MADVSLLTAEVDALEEVVPSAVALIDGFTGRMEAAVAEAVRVNDQADLSAITNEINQIKAQRDTLAAAVARNTVAAPEVEGDGTPEGGTPA